MGDERGPSCLDYAQERRHHSGHALWPVVSGAGLFPFRVHAHSASATTNLAAITTRERETRFGEMESHSASGRDHILPARDSCRIRRGGYQASFCSLCCNFCCGVRMRVADLRQEARTNYILPSAIEIARFLLIFRLFVELLVSICICDNKLKHSRMASVENVTFSTYFRMFCEKI